MIRHAPDTQTPIQVEPVDEAPPHAQLELAIHSQPTDTTCGATCLQAVYRYYRDDIELDRLIEQVEHLEEGGTLAVLLGCHALARGYRATITSYNLQIFDPTWARLDAEALAEKLRERRARRPEPKLRRAIEGYLGFLELGGTIEQEDLTPALLGRHLSRGTPILTGLSANYLYRSPRTSGPDDEDDDVAGDSTGHFVVLAGYDLPRRQVLVADPYADNPYTAGSPDPYYHVSVERLVGAIFLGILTYDGNLLVLEPPEEGEPEA